MLMVNPITSGAHSSPILQQFACCLVFQQPYFLGKFQCQFLNDDTYQWDSVTLTVSFFRLIEQGTHFTQ